MASYLMTSKPKKLFTKTPAWQGRDFNLEARFQAAIVSFIRAAAPTALVWHNPNGGPGRSLSRLAWMGAISGMTDLTIVDEHGLAHFAEIKPPDGKLSPAQIEFRDDCRRRRLPWACWTTVNDAERDLLRWGFKLRGRVSA